MEHKMRQALLTSVVTFAMAFSVASVSANEAGDDNLFAELTVETDVLRPMLDPEADIAVARLDGGRLIPMPYVESQDWGFLSKRTNTNFEQLGTARYIKNIPELPYGSTDTVNKIDEIRLAASGEGFDYVLIYGVGPDAGWASFGGRVLSETGLIIQDDCVAWEAAKAKALLVESRSGVVLGAVTSDNI